MLWKCHKNVIKALNSINSSNYLIWKKVAAFFCVFNVDYGLNTNATIKVKPKKKIKKRNISLTERIIKRIIDIIGGLVGCIILIPLTIVLYIANKLSKDDGPLFFIQERIGQNGKKFKMIKYRSMEVGADEKLEKFLIDTK